MIKRDVFFEYWDDTAITTIKKRIPYLGNIKHGLAKEFYETGSIYSKSLYKFGQLLKIVYYHHLSNGAILKSNDMDYSEYVEQDGRILLKEWHGRVDKKILLSEAETKNGVLHGQKIVYRYGDGTISEILKYKDGKLEGLSYGFDKQGRSNSKVNYKNGVRHGEAILFGYSMYPESALVYGTRRLGAWSIMNQGFLGVYENGELIELYMDNDKTIKVHESMFNEVSFSADLP